MNSLLDQDLYNFTQGQWAFHNQPAAQATYRLYVRGKSGDEKLVARKDEICERLNAFQRVALRPDELRYLRSLGLFSDDYLAYLNEYRYYPREVSILERGGNFLIEVHGDWARTILWETPLLATLSEVALQGTGSIRYGRGRLLDKAVELNSTETEVNLVEFGTRRRYSADWQRTVVGDLFPYLAGTSNVLLAKDFGLKPFGTLAHQYLSAWQVFARNYDTHQREALNSWLQEHNGKLGIALTDCAGTDAFLAEFDYALAALYQGVRHDSGNPVEWGEKIIRHYQKLGIDPKTKTAVWSDSLDIPTAIALARAFNGRFGKTVFGIGTNLTNDVGVKPLDAVLKLHAINGRPVAKLSDIAAKATGKPEAIDRLTNYVTRVTA